jgi:L-alanine-DL-glutamate epimerase-like enolase superfamily enzyme
MIPALDAARIQASLADRKSGEYFIVDANGSMTPEMALRLLRLLPPGLDFVLEAPCATLRECISLRRRTDIPMIWDELATDEASIAQLVAGGAAEGIGLKISKNGGGGWWVLAEAECRSRRATFLWTSTDLPGEAFEREPFCNCPRSPQ